MGVRARARVRQMTMVSDAIALSKLTLTLTPTGILTLPLTLAPPVHSVTASPVISKCTPPNQLSIWGVARVAGRVTVG